jgi:hypothetical protein
MNSGNLNFLEPSGPQQACNGTVLPSCFSVDSTQYHCSVKQNEPACFPYMYQPVTSFSLVSTAWPAFDLRQKHVIISVTLTPALGPKYPPNKRLLNVLCTVFSTMDQHYPVGQGLLIVEDSWSHSDTPHSVGLLWTSDQLDAENYTWQHITLTRDRHPPLRLDSNLQSQQASARRSTP